MEVTNDLNIAVLMLLTVVSISLVCLGPKDATGKVPLISAYSFVMISFLLYVVLSASLIIVFNDGAFTWAAELSSPTNTLETLLVCAYAIVVFWTSYSISSVYVFGNRHNGQLKSKIHGESPLQLASSSLPYSLVAIGVAMKMMIIYQYGGLTAAALHLSHGVSQSLGLDDAGQSFVYLSNLSQIADAGAAWLLLDAMAARRSSKAKALVLISVMCLSYFTVGKRLILLWPMLCAGLGVHSYLRRLSISLLPLAVAGVIGFGMLSLFGRVFLPASLSDATIDLNAVTWANGSIIRFYLYSLELSTFEMTTVSIQKADVLCSMFGGVLEAFYTANVEPFLYIIPRAIWAGKPSQLHDVAHAVAAYVFSTNLDVTTLGLNSTIIGASWTLGGSLGLTASMLGFGWCCATLDLKSLSPEKLTPRQIIRYAFYLTLVFHTYRQGTLGWVFLITVVSQSGLLLGFTLLFYGQQELYIIPKSAERLMVPALKVVRLRRAR